LQKVVAKSINLGYMKWDFGVSGQLVDLIAKDLLVALAAVKPVGSAAA